MTQIAPETPSHPTVLQKKKDFKTHQIKLQTLFTVDLEPGFKTHMSQSLILDQHLHSAMFDRPSAV